MKTVILLRHSKPKKNTELSNEQIPLSEEGAGLVKELFSHPVFGETQHLWSSPYRRALETAEMLGLPIRTDSRLRERDLGDPAMLDAKFWGRQYREQDFKNPGGESMNEVRRRMSDFMAELLDSMAADETAAVVSHAAAICAYLLNFCSITVTNEEKKLRRISFEGQTILDGAVATPSAFVLSFDNHKLTGLFYLQN